MSAMLRICSILLLSAVACPPIGEAAAHIAPAAQVEDVATDFARAYMDVQVYVEGFRAGLHARVAACLAASQITTDQAATRNAAFDRYMDALRPEFPVIQEKVAVTMRGAFDAVQLTELDTFYRSPTGRKMVDLVVGQIVDAMSAGAATCGDKLQPLDKQKVAADAIGKLSPLELEDAAAFGGSDTGRKFHDFQPTLMATLGPALRDSIARAAQAAGITREML